MARLSILAFTAAIIATSAKDLSSQFANRAKTDATICKSVPMQCEDSKYRSHDGSCNNLNHSWWGTPGTPYISHCDPGVDLLLNKSLPNPRQLSLKVFVNLEKDDPIWTLLFMQYGQILAHDISLTFGVAQTKKDAITCCANGTLTSEASTNSKCAPMPIPEDDPYNAPEGIKCMDFFRVETTKSLNCTNAPEIPQSLTAVTAYMDLSYIYGSDNDTAATVRAYSEGRLASVFRKGKEVLPQDSEPKFACNVNDDMEPCYMAGDTRVNQNPQLALLHIIFMNHHNFIAAKLAQVNPHWGDETVFQETRKIEIAIHQCIIYKEYLPGILGKKYMIENGLLYNIKSGFINDYDPKVNPGPSKEYAALAFRIFHSEIVGILRSVKENRNTSNIIRLSDWFDRPSICEHGNNIEGLTRGLAYQLASAEDRFMPEDILNLLFKDGLLGLDLKAIDIQRGRDQGVCFYSQLLRLFGPHNPQSFDDLAKLKIMDPEKVELLKKCYDNFEDVEAAVAMPLENSLNDALSSGLAQAIIGEQFKRSRIGDRCFFENGQGKCALTEDQLNEVRRQCFITSILCSNKNIKKMQPEGFKKVSGRNQLKDCTTYPKFNPLPWKQIPFPN